MKKAFTLIEIVVTVAVIAIGLTAVLYVLNNGMNFVQKTRQQVIATNLAREGVELMFTLRDTNRQKFAGQKDACRLVIAPHTVTDDCATYSWTQSGQYVIQTTTHNGQIYPHMTGYRTTGFNLQDGLQSGDYHFSMCQSATGGRYSCPGQLPDSKEGYFFRSIHSKGIFAKNTANTGGNQLICTNGNSVGCGTSTAKEYRFCSRVGYVGDTINVIEICSMLTNFVE